MIVMCQLGLGSGFRNGDLWSEAAEELSTPGSGLFQGIRVSEDCSEPHTEMEIEQMIE